MDVHPAIMLAPNRRGCGCGGCFVQFGKLLILAIIVIVIIAVIAG